MICCLCTAENPCSPTCLALPDKVRRRNLRGRWWQIRKRLRWLWARFQSWRRWRRFLKHGVKFPVIRNPGTFPKMDDVVSAQPMTRRTSRAIFTEFPTDYE